MSIFPPKLPSENIQKVRSERRVFVKADKSSNYYLTEKERQEELIQREIHKVYKKGRRRQRG